ncbi:MAG: type VI secretion system membrane subunit TssM, partial [Burkholderiaceae bacterium]|nr:type VI secretion system membrane subunit TssM [Burkholderiaceae bacterium]
MKTFFNAAFFRAAALMLLVVVLCVAIWVFGPVLALGALRPLEGVGARVAVMGLLLAFTLLWVAGKPVSPVFVIAAALLVWTAGPLLAVGASRPLQEPWVRAAFIGVIVLLYLVWAVWRLLHAIGNDRQLLDRLLGRKKAEAELAQDEIRTMRDIARRAVARLRDMRSTGGWLRVMFEGRRYLYELPWYVVIGNAGAGKTSAVQNAGLRFPVLPELSTSSIAAQAGGTLQCGWWFTDEAVLVDTAGRFTRHVEGAGLASTGPTSTHAPAADRPNGDEEKAGTEAQKEEGVAPHPGATAPADPGRVNAAAWRGLLGVLRHVRPRAPVNGALLMVDASRLMASDAPAILSLAADLRARLEEMRAALGVRFPVYVVLTKCDALNGFAEYFASLTAEARAQVWGVT